MDPKADMWKQNLISTKHETRNMKHLVPELDEQTTNKGKLTQYIHREVTTAGMNGHDDTGGVKLNTLNTG